MLFVPVCSALHLAHRVHDAALMQTKHILGSQLESHQYFTHFVKQNERTYTAKMMQKNCFVFGFGSDVLRG